MIFFGFATHCFFLFIKSTQLALLVQRAWYSRNNYRWRCSNAAPRQRRGAPLLTSILRSKNVDLITPPHGTGHLFLFSFFTRFFLSLRVEFLFLSWVSKTHVELKKILRSRAQFVDEIRVEVTSCFLLEVTRLRKFIRDTRAWVCSFRWSRRLPCARAKMWWVY